MLQFIEKIGEWNPQFIREIKGRLKFFPIVVTTVISFIAQAVVFLAQLGQIPGKEYPMSGEYCGIGKSFQEQLNDLRLVNDKLQKSFYHYSSKKYFEAEKLDQVRTQLKEVNDRRDTLTNTLYKQPCPHGQIDMMHWWRDHWEYIFQSLSIIFIIALLVAGTYLLIHNLAQEERQGTLNFIRLSPQSEASILIGKMLGVPILVYWFVVLAMPFHIFSGKVAGIAYSHIFSYYVVLASSCIFFFSAAFLFSLVTPFLGGFQPWLGAGAVLMFLCLTFSTANYGEHLNYGAAWFMMLSPVDMTSYLFPNFFISYNRNWGKYKDVQFFYMPLGANVISFLGIHLANYGLWIKGIWQGLIRRFRNSNTSVISKLQSYYLVAFVQILLWGFTLQNFNLPYPDSRYSKIDLQDYDVNYIILVNLPAFAIFNFALLLGLIFILSQERQTIQDWSRYRYQGRDWWHNSLLRDLLFGEKSPALLALTLHLLMMVIPITVWVALSKQFNVPSNNVDVIDWLIQLDRFKIILGIALLTVVCAIGATIAQRMLLLKTPKRYLWALGTTSAVMFAPAMILAILNGTIAKNSVLWLFSIYPWTGLANANLPIVFMALFAEVVILILLNIDLVKQIKLAGKS